MNGQVEDRLRGSGYFIFISTVVLFAVCVCRYWESYDPNDRVAQHGAEMGRIAINVYKTGEFRDPYFAMKTGPTAHVNPLFPILIASTMHVFGTQAAGIFAIKLIAVLVMAVQVALLPAISERLEMGALNGLIAACIWIAAKPMLQYFWESSYAALLLAIGAVVYRRYIDHDESGTGIAWVLGALIGLCILLMPTIAPVIGTWLLLDIMHRDWKFVRARILPLFVLPALIVAPWLVRNYRVFHRALLRDNFGLELGSANNDCAQFSVQLNEQAGCNIHPNVNVAEALKVAQMGEPQYNAMRQHEAFQWIEAHPRRFMELTATRVAAFWFPSETAARHLYTGFGRRRERGLMYLMSILCAPGLLLLYRKDRVSFALCIVCLLLFPIPYYITQFVFWHEYPVLWMIFLLGSLPITMICTQLIPSSQRAILGRRGLRAVQLRHDQ